MNQPLIEFPFIDNGMGLLTAAFSVNIIKAISESGLRIQIAQAGDSLATRGMNAATNNFLAGNADELLIIDGDIVTTGEHLRMLFSHDVELVYGTYPKRQPKLEMCLAPLTNDSKPDPENPLWEVRRAGRGYVRIARSLLEKMKEDNGGPAKRFHNHGRVEWDFWPSEVIQGEYSTAGEGVDADGYPKREFISEDWGFCDRARALGVPVYVDWRIQTLHLGQCAFPIRYTEDMLPEILRNFPDKVIEANWRKVQQMRKPAMRWDQIQGWCDECNDTLFCWLADRIPDGGRYVEVGCWLGRATACFGTHCREAGKEIEINVVDTFEGTKAEPCLTIQADILEQLERSGTQGIKNSFLPLFTRHMRATMTPVQVHQGESLAMVDHFADNSLDAAYIDGEHTYDAVFNDIRAWLPKVKPGGVLCGDDYGIDFPGVTAAVNNVLGKEKIRQQGKVWIYEVPA
jgi:hypothetical protein